MGEAVKSIRDRMVKFYAKDDNTITLNATPGHFATSSSHINFYIDVTRLKVRANEAREAARSIKNKMLHHVTDSGYHCLHGWYGGTGRLSGRGIRKRTFRK